jgi:CubicO group peptidase (beta-lactamase class C family)
LDFFDGVVGDKGVYTTTSDMYTWSKMLRSSCLVSKETLTQMFLPRSFEKPGRKNYGYGFRLLDTQNDSTKIIYHNGWWKGYNTSFYMSPFAKYTIVVLGNKFNKTVYQAQPIIDILTGKLSESIEGLEGAD